jgi:4-hydroxy-tetrahydrodipicolinate synthase
VVLQDHPASTLVNMSVPLLARLVNEIPTIACVKLESLPTPPKIALLKTMMREDCTILTGLGALYGAYDIEAGGDGFMTGFAFPEALAAIVDAKQAGDEELLWKIYQHWLPLMVFEQQPGVAVRKELYKQRGLIECSIPRHPAAGISPLAAGMLTRTIATTVGPTTDITKPVTDAAVIRGEF